MSKLTVFAYCAAFGFVTAAVIASFYQWVTSQQAELFALKPSVSGLAFAVVLSIFCGPFLVVRRVISGLRGGDLTALPAIIGVVIAGMWSVCAGIFYVSLMLGV